MLDTALLVLEDGTVFRGRSIGARGAAVGEVVFNTSITGYQEILTDPSYARQIVTLTYPHIGNVGTNTEDEESGKVFCAGLVVRDLSQLVSNWRSSQRLDRYLKQRETVAIADIDTRKLTRLLRQKGAQNGCILAGDTDDVEALSKARAFPGLGGMDLAKEVSITEPYTWSEGSWTLGQGFHSDIPPSFAVVAYDFGVKRNILRLLADRGCRLTVVPAQTPAEEALARKPDGIFLANGPGDPEPCDYAIDSIRIFLEKEIPLFGICLGHQLFSLACGARSFKMKTGHHGANHPVQDLASGKVFITSQNHGFTVADEGLPENLRITHRSLFDGTIQGVERTDKPAFGFQGHPEASPGPHDIQPLFDRFISLMEAGRGGVENA